VPRVLEIFSTKVKTMNECVRGHLSDSVANHMFIDLKNEEDILKQLKSTFKRSNMNRYCEICGLDRRAVVENFIIALPSILVIRFELFS